MARIISVLSSLVIFSLAACGSPASSPGSESSQQSSPTTATAPAAPPPPAAADPVAQAQEMFATRCTVCHGPTGEGNGPGSAALTPKPRNFSLADWQASVTDDHISKIIQYGGAAVGKSPSMPGNPDLIDKPAVVEALVKKVRSFKK